MALFFACMHVRPGARAHIRGFFWALMYAGGQNLGEFLGEEIFSRARACKACRLPLAC